MHDKRFSLSRVIDELHFTSPLLLTTKTTYKSCSYFATLLQTGSLNIPLFGLALQTLAIIIVQMEGTPARPFNMPPPIALNALNEEEVLKPEPQAGDPDEWPCHVLRQATIYNHDRKSLVNLLEAELHGPFIIQGKLEVDKQYKSQCKCHSHEFM